MSPNLRPWQTPPQWKTRVLLLLYASVCVCCVCARVRVRVCMWTCTWISLVNTIFYRYVHAYMHTWATACMLSWTPSISISTNGPQFLMHMYVAEAPSASWGCQSASFASWRLPWAHSSASPAACWVPAAPQAADAPACCSPGRGLREGGSWIQRRRPRLHVHVHAQKWVCCVCMPGCVHIYTIHL